MEKKMNSEELQSRREFFKKAGKRVLPFIGLVAFGPTFFTSCSKDDGDDGSGDDGRGDENSPHEGGNSPHEGGNSPHEGGDSPQADRGDGSVSHPFSVAEVIAYAKTLNDGEASSARFYVKGIVDSCVEFDGPNPDGWDYSYVVNVTLTDGDDDGESIVAQIKTNSVLKEGDTVVVCGKVANYWGYICFVVGDVFLYSWNERMIVNSSCSDCTAACSGNCSETCYNSCTGGCMSSCASGCGNSCEGSCSGTCSSTCTGGCYSGCTGTCSSGCTGECSASCTGGCKSSCTAECSSNCSGGCSSGCDITCRLLCTRTCTGGCDSSCYSGCLYSCRGGCYGQSYRYG